MRDLAQVAAIHNQILMNINPTMWDRGDVIGQKGSESSVRARAGGGGGGGGHVNSERTLQQSSRRCATGAM
jgi:hypothetical protein